MKKRYVRMAALLAIGAVTLAACGGDSDGTTSEGGTAGTDAAAGGGGEYDVYALLPQGNDQPYGTTYLPPFRSTAEELGLNLTITNSQYDADKQASECEVAVAAQPDLIILWPAVSDTVRPCLAAANAAGIPVTITNADVNEEDRDLTRAYSGPNTYEQGAVSAELFCEEAGDEAVGAVMVNGLTGNSVAIEREAGFAETVTELCDVEILARQPGNWNKDESQVAASEMITSVGAGNIGGLYAADDTMVAGAISALEGRGIDADPLVITSIGNTELGNPLVVGGELDGTVFQSSTWDGEKAAEMAHRVLTEDPQERLVEFMPNVKVTQENAEDPAVEPEW